jgi:adenosylcobinamide-GDP ribazoletransferase
MTVLDGLRLAVGTLTVLPVPGSLWDGRRDCGGDGRRGRATSGAAMAWAPAVGAVLGGFAGAALWLATAVGLGRTLAAVAAIATLALLTRGLHLDGLADTADGLGSGALPDEALRIMKASDIGPFGVVTLVLTLLAQVAALAQLRPVPAVAALVIGAATGRLAITWACREGVPAARPVGLGASVAGSVPPAVPVVLTGGALLGATALTSVAGADPLRAALAVLAGLAAAHGLLAHCRRRFGGVTGDVLGALVETATTVTLLVLATS